VNASISDQQRTTQIWRWLAWIVAGALFGMVAAVAALALAGDGHGSFVLAAIYFPYALLGSSLVRQIGPVMIVVALAQYPVYGAFATRAEGRGRRLAQLALVHMGFAVAALMSMRLVNAVS